MVEGHDESLRDRAARLCWWSEEDEGDEEVSPEGGLQESQR